MPDFCKHLRVSNAEIDYVISKIMDGTYLYAPPCGTDSNGKHFHQPSDLIDAKTYDCLSYRPHSQSPAEFPVLCQRCNIDLQKRFYVQLNRVYDRMLKKGIIEEFPKVVHIGKPQSFGYNVIVL
jgi:hypothetical protein